MNNRVKSFDNDIQKSIDNQKINDNDNKIEKRSSFM